MNRGVEALVLGMGLLMACPALRWGVHLLTVSDNHQGRAFPIYLVGAACRDTAIEVGSRAKQSSQVEWVLLPNLPTLCLQDTRGGEDG